MPSENQKRGAAGENAAVVFLEKNGYIILERNYNTRFGEIDIIAGKGDIVAFVEVKTRSGKKFGAPADAVGFAKAKKIKRAALHYVSAKKITDKNFRFDIMEVSGAGALSVNHIESAFFWTDSDQKLF